MELWRDREYLVNRPISHFRSIPQARPPCPSLRIHPYYSLPVDRNGPNLGHFQQDNRERKTEGDNNKVGTFSRCWQEQGKRRVFGICTGEDKPIEKKKKTEKEQKVERSKEIAGHGH
ncbi:hypothetical protein EUGRSUZ_L01600 [Eucalyptus grandis]|uniref:Uncharacterized protein n=1 Tax=Eucalyptus grandis TaxID=71139 RepID=A0A058ZTZ6_EUCGR|nr:hypothetical protein EUGRSUZ_L01600 [Eucalyptus grandis]